MAEKPELRRPIQTIPPGLLDFLQLKSLGKNLEFFPDVWTPVLELRDWAFQARAAFIQATVQTPFANGAVGFSTWSATDIALWTVPNTELWYVTNYSIYCEVLAAAEVTQFQGAWRSQSGSLHFVGQPSARVAGTAAGTTNNQQATDFWVAPGSVLGLRIMENAAAVDIDYAWNAQVIKLRI